MGRQTLTTAQDDRTSSIWSAEQLWTVRGILALGSDNRPISRIAGTATRRKPTHPGRRGLQGYKVISAAHTVRALEIFQIAPVLPHADFHDQRDGEGVDLFHVLAHQRAHDVEFLLGYFEYQLVVNLESHAGFQVAVADGFIDANHGDLDQISSSALQRGVDGRAFRESALLDVFPVNVGNRADATVQRCDFLIAARLFERLIDKRAHPAVLLKVRVDELLGFPRLNTQILRKSEGGQSVDDTEIHYLGGAAMFSGDHQGRNSENLRRCERVHVVATIEGFYEQPVA